MPPVLPSIGVLCNAAAPDRKQLTQKWAAEWYPHLWQELNKLGHKTTPEGIKVFNVDRELSP